MVDHGSGRLVWAAPGRDTKTLRRLFDALGAERSAQITHVSADAADWIAEVITERCPDAIQCADPFHAVARVTEAVLPSGAGAGQLYAATRVPGG